ncbi:MAG: hypothetical protein MZV64_27865 [Ignavibacteriales bacterium]|nr:hypothetical protein [Ignavibacteriales bacterium]
MPAGRLIVADQVAKDHPQKAHLDRVHPRVRGEVPPADLDLRRPRLGRRDAGGAGHPERQVGRARRHPGRAGKDPGLLRDGRGVQFLAAGPQRTHRGGLRHGAHHQGRLGDAALGAVTK